MSPVMRLVSLLLLAIVSLSACGDASDDAATDTGAGGGLSVSEAMQTDATGPITVEGFLIEDSDSVRLCEVARESYPPQCGGASLEVGGVDVASLDGATTEGDVTWVDRETLTGELHDGSLHVTDTIKG